MSYKTKVTSKGTITISAPLRKKYGIRSGQKLIIEDDQGELIIHPPTSTEDLREMGQSNAKKLPENLQSLSWESIRQKAAESRKQAGD